MRMHLNTVKPYSLYRSETLKPYFIDKTMLLQELFPLVTEGNNYICVTRPRRFGKTVMANMIASFFGKGKESGGIFDNLSIGTSESYKQHLNQYNMIHISFNQMPKNCKTYEGYIGRIEKRLISDLGKAYPDIERIVMEQRVAYYE